MAVSEVEPEFEESRFVPQSGDEENLWEIVGIVGEKGTKYRVKWAGEDPKTGKPWGNSWVRKSDVTPDVVDVWKEKQAQKAQRKAMKRLSTSKSKKSPPSTVSNRTATATARRARASISVVKREPSPSPPPPDDDSTSRPPPSVSTSPRKKRKHSVVQEPASDSSDTPTVQEPRKKRKVSREPSRVSSKVFHKPQEEESEAETRKKHKHARREEEESDEDRGATTKNRSREEEGSERASKSKKPTAAGGKRASGSKTRKGKKSAALVVSDGDEEPLAAVAPSRYSDDDDDDWHPPPDVGEKLTPLTKQRLDEFEASLLTTKGNSRSAIAPYGESDVDTVAANIMYPTEPPVPPRSRSPQLVPAPPAPSRTDTLKVKMKPRTPRVSSAAPKSKQQLKPIPTLSPSKFHPHLPPRPSFPETTIDEVGSFDEAEPMSSIEQFDSPEKPAKVRVLPATVVRKHKGMEGEHPFLSSPGLDPDDEEEDHIVSRGQEIYEQFKAKEPKKPAPPRPTLVEVVEQHRSSSDVSERASPSPPPPPSLLSQQLPASSPLQPSPELEADSVPIPDDDFDDFYVDEPTIYNDSQMPMRNGKPEAPQQYVPEEEEESTQDLLQELEVGEAVSEGVPSRSPTPEVPVEQTRENTTLDPQAGEEDSMTDISMEPQPGTLPARVDQAKVSSPIPPENENSSQRFVDGTQEILPPARPEQDSQESTSTVDSTEQMKHIGYMNLLNAKSEEIEDLSRQLREEQERKLQLEALVASLQDQLRVATLVREQTPAPTEQPQQQNGEALTKQLAEVTERFKDAQEGWEKDKELLVKQVEAATSKHDTVHNLFMEQYSRVTELSKEKKQLQQEAEIARSQAEVGVKAIRELHQRREKDLMDDKNQWKRNAMMMMDRETRFNYHELLAKAAEYEELKAKYTQKRKRLAEERLKNSELEDRLELRSREVEALRIRLGNSTPTPMPNGSGQVLSSSPDASPEGSICSQGMAVDEDDDEEDEDYDPEQAIDDEENGSVDGEGEEEVEEEDVVESLSRSVHEGDGEMSDGELVDPGSPRQCQHAFQNLKRCPVILEDEEHEHQHRKEHSYAEGTGPLADLERLD